jgi:cytochrome P450
LAEGLDVACRHCEVIGRRQGIGIRCDVGADVESDDVGTLAGQLQRMAATLPSRGPADDDDLARNSTHCSPLLVDRTPANSENSIVFENRTQSDDIDQQGDDMTSDASTTTAETAHDPGYATIDFEYRHGGTAAGEHFRLFDELREQYPFFKTTADQGWWTVTRADLIREAYQRPDVFCNAAVVVSDPDPMYLWIPEMLDGAPHKNWRQLLAPYFSPGAIAKMEGRVRQRCIDLIDSFVSNGSCDFLNDFARKYPTTIFMELMGLPVGEAEKFMEWEDMILHGPPPGATLDEANERRMNGMLAVMGYFSELVGLRRTDPQDDLVTFVVNARIDGEPIPDNDILAFCLLMFMAGLDTVAMQLCWSFLHLATHPNDRARLVADPSLIPTATEEFLRAFAFVVPSRRVTQDIDFHGCPMKAGDMVLLPLCSATRDPRAFERPDEVIIDRSPNPHIAFGAGPHRCLGSTLARQELHVAFEEWHRRIPDYRVADEAVITEHGGQLGLDLLPLRWD